jgi:predicted lysophospholipase L1 biosynthesis ABC-type transport system permease subunit
VGVARDAKYRSLGEQPRSVIYVPLAQHYNSELWIMMRTAGPSAIPALRSLLRDMDPNLPLVQATTLADATAFALLPSRIAAWLAVMVGVVGVLLAALGIYGLTAYHVSQRTREIGVRMALGASRVGILRMVLRQATTITGAGLLAGLALALLATRLLTSLLYGVAPIDPVSFAGGAALLGTLALLAALIPASRATRVDPVTSLRAE